MLNFRNRMPLKWQSKWRKNLIVKREGTSSKVPKPDVVEISDKLEKQILKEIRSKMPKPPQLQEETYSPEEKSMLNRTQGVLAKQKRILKTLPATPTKSKASNRSDHDLLLDSSMRTVDSSLETASFIKQPESKGTLKWIRQRRSE